MKTHITLLCLFMASITFAQNQTKHVLFLGNSYTYVNDLPQMLADVALSTGDTVLFDSNTPGGYTLQLHSSNAISISKITTGNWDFVVLQEQSQLPSFPIAQVETDVFPFANYLDSIINFYNPCVETAFYMTWGRKNGDASNCSFWPPVCTYDGMDSLLNLRYRMMADSNAAILSPVGAVWNYIRKNNPNIELYSADESHPSLYGTYAAACCFYATIFRKDPTLITYNSTLTSADADSIKLAAKLIVYDSLTNWNVGAFDPISDFNFNIVSNQVSFLNTSTNAINYSWDFGDGNSSTLANPIHTYANTGTYLAKLVAEKCLQQNSISKSVTINVSGITSNAEKNNSITISPNPAKDIATLNIEIKNSSAVTITIVDLLGRVVYNQNYEKQQPGFHTFNLNLQTLEKGVYFVKLQAGELFGMQKIVIE